ncbi:MAG: hypothetical protein GY940_37230 [bacterium]|nr:hypothetical protein [bacterium]
MLSQTFRFFKHHIARDTRPGAGSLEDIPRPYLFEDHGQISYGPPYYRIKLNGKYIRFLVVGEPRLEIPEKSTVILQKWHTIYEEDGPLTSLLALNWQTGRKKVLTHKVNGWWTPHFYRDSQINADVEYWVTKKDGEMEKITEETLIDFR